MMSVYKYPVPTLGRFWLKLPGTQARVLFFGLDPSGTPCVWALVEPGADEYPVEMIVVGTGNELQAKAVDWKFVGTVKQSVYMWHLFLV